MQAEIADLKAQHDMDWLRVNAQPIKQALGTWTTKWMYTYTHYLQSHIMDNRTGVYEFMRSVDSGLGRVTWLSLVLVSIALQMLSFHPT